jgi:hypothetical protein
VPDSSPRDPLRALRALRRLPLWARWLLTLLAYAVVIVAIVLVVRLANSAGSSSEASQSEAAAETEANRVGQVAIREDEAPHSVPLHSTASPRSALELAIAADVRGRIADGQLTGPLQSVRCKPAGAPQAARRPFSCTVTSAGIAYPFLGVADERTLQLTWCKVDPPPAADAPLEVPVSPRCHA